MSCSTCLSLLKKKNTDTLASVAEAGVVRALEPLLCVQLQNRKKRATLRAVASICAVTDFNPLSMVPNKECLRMLQCNGVTFKPYTSTGNGIFQHCFCQ